MAQILSILAQFTRQFLAQFSHKFGVIFPFFSTQFSWGRD